MEKGWVELHRFAFSPDAEIVRQMLESNDIPCILLNQRDSSYLSFGEVRLFVKNTDYVRARGLLDQSKQ